jgi:hypothetical protein
VWRVCGALNVPKTVETEHSQQMHVSHRVHPRIFGDPHLPLSRDTDQVIEES